MRPLLAFLALSLPLCAEEAPRVPLAVLGTHYLRTGDERALPLATVGSAPEGSATIPSFTALVQRIAGSRDGRRSEDPACEALVQALTDGSSTLRPVQPGGQALVFLVGPWLNSGERWEPTSLSLEGNTFSLVITSWRDNGPRRRNVPMKPTVLLSLGEVAAGDYELAITYRGMFLDVEKKQPRYVMDALQNGPLPFHVLATPEAGGEPATMPQGALRVAAIERTEPNAQRPDAGTYRLRTRPGEALKPCVQVGTFDLAAWAQTEGGPAAPPELAPPADGDVIYACVTGPERNSGEWMSLASVTWTKDGVRLVVEVWRDNGARDRNTLSTPVLVVPLERPAAAGTYRVDVEWSTLVAPSTGGLYSPEHDPLLEPVHADFELR